MPLLILQMGVSNEVHVLFLIQLQSISESSSESSIEDLFEEQEEPLPSLRIPPSTVSDQLASK